MNKSLRYAVILLVLAGAGFGVYKWVAQRKASAQAAAATAEAAKVVAQTLELAPTDVYTLRTLMLEQNLPVSGSLRAVNSAVVKARVAGELMDLRLREGDSVQQGQVVARVDPTEYAARQRQAQRQVDAAMAQVEVAQKQYDNNQALVEQGFISKTALDTSLSNLNGAKASHLAAVAGLDVARKAMDDSVLKAPLTGKVSQRLAQPGERVAPDTRIMEIVDLSQLEVEAAIPPQDAVLVQLGQTARLNLEGSPQAVTARVQRINPSTQAGSRSVLVYLGLQAHPSLRQGLFVQGQLATTQVQALAAPVTSVRTDKPQPYVQWIDKGQVKHLTVTLGARGQVDGQEMVAVTGMGTPLPEGVVLLTSNAGAVREGTLVKFTTVKP